MRKKLTILLLLLANVIIFMEVSNGVQKLWAAQFNPGYVGGNIYAGEIHVNNGGDDELIIPNGASLQYGSLANGSSAHVSTGIVWLAYSPTVSTNAVGAASFVDGGGGLPDLNDLTSSGTFTGIKQMIYRVKIDSEGTADTYSWSEDNGTTWRRTGVTMTTDTVDLSNGVKITFAAKTGHDTDDYWTITCGTTTGTQAYPTPGTPTAGTNVNWEYIEVGQSSDIPAGVKSIKLITSGSEVAYVRYRLIY